MQRDKQFVIQALRRIVCRGTYTAHSDDEYAHMPISEKCIKNVQLGKRRILLEREWLRHDEQGDKKVIQSKYESSEQFKNDLRDMPEYDYIDSQMPHKFQYHYEWSIDDECYIHAKIQRRVLYFTIKSPKACAVRGATLFDAMMDAMDPQTFDRIRATWVYGDNLAKFSDGVCVEHKEAAAAARDTWTGKMVARRGYTRADVVRVLRNHANTRVVNAIVDFTRP